ncbi:MAG: hypothetical protein RLZZ289_1023, partial [Bacteroidota bacterium]
MNQFLDYISILSTSVGLTYL